MLTLPKLLDQSIIIINKPVGKSEKFSAQWSSVRDFIKKSSEYAIKHSIYVPPLFQNQGVELESTDNALTPVAFKWAITVARRMGFEVEMFDSLHSAVNYIESSADKRIADIIYPAIKRGLFFAKNNHHANDPWEKGLFDETDFYLANAILSYRYNVSIADLLPKMNPYKTDLKPAKIYMDLCDRNGWTPSDFCNEASKIFNLPVKRSISGSHEELFRQSSFIDEYRALMTIISSEMKSLGEASIAESELERNLLKINFDENVFNVWSKKGKLNA